MTFSTCPKNVPARTHWVRLQPDAPGEAEAGIVLASMGLRLPSQALGLALGTMPAESREETPTHPWPARKDGAAGREGPPPSSSFPRRAVQVQSPV